MNQQRLQFPNDFLWGTATAGHQVEGHNYKSDWWRFEQAGKILDGTKSGASADYWNRYDEDHDLMKQLGLQCFRLGVEWAKIEPEDGHFDLAAVKRYRQILQSLRDHGIKICLTIYHWVIPQWFADQGGWESPTAVDRFARYAEFVVKELGEFPDLWVTLNEPMVPALAGYLAGLFPPEKKSMPAYFRVTNRLLHAHDRTYALIHKHAPKAPDGRSAKAGVATAYQQIEAWGSPGLVWFYEMLIARVFTFGSFGAWDSAMKTGTIPFPFGGETLPNLRGSLDFCGVNYYMRQSIKFDPSRTDQALVDFEAIPDGIDQTQMGWQVYPPGFHKVLMRVWNTFRKPIYITENGIADDTDSVRPTYTLEHLAQVHRAIADGADVRGYLHWSFVDNFEWKEGFSKQFGLVACDHKDPELKRVPRPSAHMYSEIIRENAITPEIVEKYAPKAVDGVFGHKWRRQ